MTHGEAGYYMAGGKIVVFRQPTWTNEGTRVMFVSDERAYSNALMTSRRRRYTRLSQNRTPLALPLHGLPPNGDKELRRVPADERARRAATVVVTSLSLMKLSTPSRPYMDSSRFASE